MKNRYESVIVDGKECLRVFHKDKNFIITPDQLALIDDLPITWAIKSDGMVTASHNHITIYLRNHLLGIAPGKGRTKTSRYEHVNGNTLDFRFENLKLIPHGHYTTSNRPSKVPLPKSLMDKLYQPLPHVSWDSSNQCFTLLSSHPYMRAAKKGLYPAVPVRGTKTGTDQDKYASMVGKLAELDQALRKPPLPTVDDLPQEAPKRQKLDYAKLATMKECRERLAVWQGNPSLFLLWKPWYRELLLGCQPRFPNEEVNSFTGRQALAKKVLHKMTKHPEGKWTLKLCNMLSRLENKIELRAVGDHIDRPLDARIKSFSDPLVLQRLEQWGFEQSDQWIAKEAARHRTGHTHNTSKTPLPTLKHLMKRHGLDQDQVEVELDRIMKESNIVTRATAQVFLRQELANDAEAEQWEAFLQAKRVQEGHKYRQDLHTRVASLLKVARRRGLPVEVNLADVIVQPCLYCGSLHPGHAFSGVDRIDSTIKAYTPTNSVPACGFCNQGKGDSTVGTFLQAVANVVMYQQDGHVGPLVQSRREPFTFARFIEGAIAREKRVEFGQEEFAELIAKPCTYCGVLDPNGSGIDRIDSDLDYVRGNVCACCAYCNRLKFRFPVEWFLTRCRDVYARRDVILAEIARVQS